MKIHGIAYILIGAGVAFGSWAISFDSMKFFFFIGIVFIIVGVFKIFFLITNKSSDEKNSVKTAAKPHHIGHYNIQQHNVRLNQSQQTHQYKRCPRCANMIHANSNFCARCGNIF